MHAASIEDHKSIIAGAEKRVAESEQQKAVTAGSLEAAKDRIARIERGETCQALAGPVSYKDFVTMIGGPAVTRHCERLAELYEAGGEAAQRAVVDELMRITARAEKIALRTTRKRYGLD